MIAREDDARKECIRLATSSSTMHTHAQF